MKGLWRIYKQGWLLIGKALILAIIIWILLLPFKVLESAGEILPDWMIPVLGLVLLLIYLPLAAYAALRGLNDLNRTDHKIIPLFERIRGRR